MNKSLLEKRFDLEKNKTRRQVLNFQLRTRSSNFANPLALGAGLGAGLGLAKGSLEQDDGREVPVDQRMLKVLSNSGAGALLGSGAGLVGDAVVNDYPGRVNAAAGAVGLPGVREGLQSKVDRARAAKAAGRRTPTWISDVRDAVGIGRRDVGKTIDTTKQVLAAAPGVIDRTAGSIVGGGAGSLIGAGAGHLAGEALLPGIGGHIGQVVGGAIGGVAGTATGAAKGVANAIKTAIPGTDENLNAELAKLEGKNQQLAQRQAIEQERLARENARVDIGKAQVKADRAGRTQKAAEAYRSQQRNAQTVAGGFKKDPFGYIKAKAAIDLQTTAAKPLETAVDAGRRFVAGSYGVGKKLRGLVPFSYMEDNIASFANPPNYVPGLQYGAIAGAAGGGILGAASAIAGQRQDDADRLNDIANIQDPYQRLRQYETYDSDLTRLGKGTANTVNTVGNAALIGGVGAGAGALAGGAGIIAYNKLRDPNLTKNILYGQPKPNRFVRAAKTIVQGV